MPETGRIRDSVAGGRTQSGGLCISDQLLIILSAVVLISDVLQFGAAANVFVVIHAMCVMLPLALI